MSTTNKQRPNLSKFHQQQLPACTPVITVRNAYPFCLFIGVLFIALGGWFLSVSRNIQEIIVPYTYCNMTTNSPGFTSCADYIRSSTFKPQIDSCQCDVKIPVESDMAGPVYVYYGLTNFYQNHRRYVRSRDDNQLNGQDVKVSADCSPYQFQTIDGVQKPILPCGAVAMSLFNDTFKLKQNGDIPWQRNNIAWPTDRSTKFGEINANMETVKNSVKPVSWKYSALERATNGNFTAFSGDEDLIVWMRTAALPTFRKLYAILDKGLSRGEYTVTIDYAYPVSQFDGTKRLIFTQSSWMGGKNDAMGIAYIVVGVIHLVLGAIFLIIDLHLIKRRANKIR